MPEQLTLDQIMVLRRTPGASVLLYLTDRCPVGCAHCSVSARKQAPALADPAGFAALVSALATRPGLRVVAVSGGEPFAERRGLTLSVRELADAGLAVVVFTSGHWAGPGPVPSWIRGVLARVSTVFLGVDAYHADRLGPDRLGQAVDAVAAAGCRVVLQLIDRPGQRERAQRLLAERLGPDWAERAELHPTRLLPFGRAARLLPAAAGRRVTEFGPCLPASAATVRHDGTVTGCCNEQVITGSGPAALRRSGGGLGEALDAFLADPLLRIMARTGPGALSGLPGFERLSAGRYPSVCGACWAAHDAVAASPVAAAVAGAVAGAAGVDGTGP
ncbi:radical SAM protein [Streptacidiphilus rugosus]|uniref:radical SAM protein n=1 Tax=Streptacidiphilus rugosus TaxID=405783 RepID=UPI00056B177C|nr:radical SAM protein [Streptacidiphilus rugosus]